ncbi:MAG: molybdate ABC transporter substrate-binding protein [Myxococcota bacterium]
MRAGLVLLAVLVGAGCTDPSDELTVLAASSLTEAFGELAQAYSRQHPGVDVRLSFAGSQVGRLQIEHGAPVDVFASAHPEHVEALVQAGLAKEPVVFAANALVLVVRAESGLTQFEDLPSARSIVLAADAVPAGRYAHRVLQAADRRRPGFLAEVSEKVVSLESNVRLVRAKVALGVADAALVYRSDAVGTGPDLRVIELPSELRTQVRYPAVELRRSHRPDQARAWVELLTSPGGQAILRKWGFEGPS